MNSPDVLVVGAGVIGLSLAEELSRQGAAVHVIDCRNPATQASWAAAGIIPFVNGETAQDEFRRTGSFKLRPLSRLGKTTDGSNGCRCRVPELRDNYHSAFRPESRRAPCEHSRRPK